MPSRNKKNLPTEPSEAPETESIPKTPIAVRKLSDLAPRRGTVIVERPGEQDDFAIPIKELSYKRHWEIGRAVESPAPPKGEVVEFRKDEKGEVRQVFSTNWQEYQQAINEAEILRTLWRVSEFVDLEFDSPLPDDPLEIPYARIDELQNTLPNDIINALVDAMRGMVSGSESRVEARASTFHGAGSRDNGHSGPQGLDNRVLADAYR